jgi:activating signal cointegrator complex subunit 2
MKNQYRLADRRNVFDNDAFNMKQIDPSQVHRGRKERANVKDILDDKRFIRSQKAKIVQTAKNQWDEYEDEYDDTYDDPERAAPASNPRLKMIRDDVDEETAGSEVEEDVESKVYKWFKKAPGTFDKIARKTKDRDALKQETKWTDEQIEGWKSMTERDPSLLRRLEWKYENQVFQQTALPSTSWKQNGSDDENSSSAHRRGTGHSGRGRIQDGG